MGQRTQIYVQFCTQNNKKGLGAFHLQFSYGYYNIIRAYQILKFIKTSIDNYQDFNMFLGTDYSSSKKVREVIKGLIDFNIFDSSYTNSTDLTREQIFENFYKKQKALNEKLSYDEIATNFLFLTEYNYKQTEYKYSIDPYVEDNNDGIIVIKIDENKNIKYAFDLLKNTDTEEFDPITAKSYIQDYKDYETHTINEKLKLQEMIKDIDSFELLSKEELQDIFNKEYEW